MSEPSKVPTLPQALLRTTLLLVGLALLFTALLSSTYELTRAPIAAAQREEALRLIRELLPASWQQLPLIEVVLPQPLAVELDLLTAAKAYVVVADGEAVALILPARSRRGYGGDVVVLAATDRQGTLLGARVSQHRETPGLGDYIDPRKDRHRATPWIDQFAGRAASEAHLWRVKKDGGTIDAYAGATISARATTEAIAKAAAVAARAFGEITTLAQSPHAKGEQR